MSICGGSRIGCEDTWRNSLRSWFSGVVGASRSTPRKIARQSLERHETGQTTRSRSGEQNGRLGVGRTTHAWSCSRCGVAFGFHRASFFPPFECPCLSSALLSGKSPRLLPRNSRPPETGPPGPDGRPHRPPYRENRGFLPPALCRFSVTLSETRTAPAHQARGRQHQSFPVQRHGGVTVSWHESTASAPVRALLRGATDEDLPGSHRRKTVEDGLGHGLATVATVHSHPPVASHRFGNICHRYTLGTVERLDSSRKA